MAYSKEHLIEKLKWLLEKYGTIQTQTIDNEPEFPSRKAYIRVFGSIKQACEEIGYYEYQRGKFNIGDAQKILNQRNNNFDLLNFNGMREKNLTKCRTCGYTWSVSTDSLLRNNTPSHGCPNCTKNNIKENLFNCGFAYINDYNGIYTVRCLKCKNVFSRYLSNITNPKFNCPECSSLEKYTKITANRELYSEKTIKFGESLFHLKRIVEEQSLMWFYILGFLFADGYFYTDGYRFQLTINKQDEDTLNKIAEFLECKVRKYKNVVEIKVSGGEIVKCLIEKYKISNKKTYEPCDISSINNENLIAFIIGFIDGDGCIKKRTDSDLYNITIKLHKNWENNLNIMITKLYYFFGLTKIPHTNIVKSNNNEYVSITFGNSVILNKLMDFIRKNNIPAIHRKWDKILNSRKYQEYIKKEGGLIV